MIEEELGNVEVINLGNSTYNTAQEYLIFKKFGRKFFPDLTVLAFYSNDVGENNPNDESRPTFSFQNGEIIQTGQPKPYTIGRQIKRFLQENSLFFSFVDYKIALLIRRLDKPIIKNFDFEEIFYAKKAVDNQGLWNLTEGLLLKINEMAGENFLIMYIPNRLQVEEDTYRRALDLAQVKENEIDLDAPNRMLAKISAAAGIPFLDLTPYLKEAVENGIPVYLKSDWHLSREGHRILGDRLKKKVQKILEYSIERTR